MKLEDQVCGLENAKKLGELGVKAESHFLRSTWNGKPSKIIEASDRMNHTPRCGKWFIPAYTVAELGEMLGKVSLAYIQSIWLSEMDKAAIGYAVNCYHPKWKNGHFEKADTEADARALMLIYLIENGHVKAEDLV